MAVQPLKWHGGKGAFNGKLARWIISLMPPHVHYVEPYFGGGSVLLHKDPTGVSEVANDIHGELMNFWNVLKQETGFRCLVRMLEATPFCEDQWKGAGEASRMSLHDETVDTPMFNAYWFFIRCRQSRAGAMKEFATLSRTRTRRGMNEQASAWLTAIEGLPEVHERLKRVVILNHDALDVIREQDGESTLFYLDPPYLHETRVTKSTYKHEMSLEDHMALSDVLAEVKGRFLLSGYRSGLYDTWATKHNWHRREFQIPNNAAGGKKKRTMTECVWMNFDPQGAAVLKESEGA